MCVQLIQNRTITNNCLTNENCCDMIYIVVAMAFQLRGLFYFQEVTDDEKLLI